MGKSPSSDRHSDAPDAPSSMHDPHDLPLSPISEASSGYFSTSVSTATLSDVSIACGDLTPTPNTQLGSVASRQRGEDSEECLPTPINASIAPVEAGIRSDRHKNEEAVHRNGVTTSQQEAQLNTNPVLSTSMDNPFSLQKVKANELRSFSNILGDGDGKATTNILEKLEITFEDSEPKELAWLKVGGRVTVGTSKSGTVRYIGPTYFSEGVWVGVELDTPSG